MVGSIPPGSTNNMTLKLSKPQGCNIWNSIEFDAISRDFCYDGYISMCNEANTEHTVMSKSSYRLLQEVFHKEMYDFYGICEEPLIRVPYAD